MPASINLQDIPPEQRRDMGIRKRREQQFTKDELRGWSLKVLALMAGLTQKQRARVLRHAAKVNRV